MTKQEEIREGIASVLEDARIGDCNCEECRGNMADALLKYLHSAGCVLKVERELPDFPIPISGDWGSGFRMASDTEKDSLEIILGLGYTAVEPLIEE